MWRSRPLHQQQVKPVNIELKELKTATKRHNYEHCMKNLSTIDGVINPTSMVSSPCDQGRQILTQSLLWSYFKWSLWYHALFWLWLLYPHPISAYVGDFCDCWRCSGASSENNCGPVDLLSHSKIYYLRYLPVLNMLSLNIRWCLLACIAQWFFLPGESVKLSWLWFPFKNLYKFDQINTTSPWLPDH